MLTPADEDREKFRIHSPLPSEKEIVPHDAVANDIRSRSGNFPSKRVNADGDHETNFSGTPRSIEEFAVRTDFPQCALGIYVDIRGFAGVVVEIVNQSIKVRSLEGITQRFNSYRLKTLCAPPDRSELVPTTRNIDPAQSPSKSTPPPRVYIAAPDFAEPVRPIDEYASRADFPKCAYGKHVDVVGYAGVVVEIVKGSLKIQSSVGVTRSYNGSTLKKLYGRALERQ